jgi:hypothetical protein
MGSPGEQAVMPGLGVLVIALVGLGYSVWAPRHRALLGGALVLTLVMAVGTSAPGEGRWSYLLLFRHVPGWEAIRTPGRLVLWATLALGLLAAGAITRLAQDLAGGRGLRSPVMAAALMLPAAAVLLEGVGSVPQPVVPRPTVALASLPAPLLVLPTSQGGDYLTMTWSTAGWPRTANGGSGFESPIQARLRRTAAAFPSAQSVNTLRADGVRTVVLERALAVGTPWETLAQEPLERLDARTSALGVQVTDWGGAVVFDLDDSAAR